MNNASSARRNIAPTSVLSGRAALAYVDDVALMVTDVSKWSDDDVLQILEASAKLGNKVTSPGAITHFFGETMGAAASQRKLIVEWMEKNGIQPTPRTITLTDSTLMRAALTAYSWLTKTQVKAFKINELDVACVWICNGLIADPAKVHEAMLGCYKLVGKKV